MERRRALSLLWPLAIWAVLFGWRTVACKGKPEAAKSSKTAPTIVYHYPPPPPTITIGPGVTTLPLEPQ